MKAWGGRFGGSPDEASLAFGRSIDVDRELALEDIDGSIAHVHGLERAGHVSGDDAKQLVAGLTALRAEVLAGTLAWDPALEDVHLNVEFALEARIGPVAGKLHTGRSRNDQVSTDMRLWTRRMIDELKLPLCNTHWGRGMWPFFQPLIVPQGEGKFHYLGEDWAFSYRLSQIGITPLADTTIRLWHWGRYGYTWEEAGSSPTRYRTYSYRL